MAGSKTAYLEAKLQQLILGNVAYTVPTTLGVALSTAAFTVSATGAAMTEVTNAGAYARVSLTNNTTTWPAPSGSAPSVLSNGVAISFPTATASWGTIYSVYILDSATYGSGNALFGCDLATPVVMNTGSQFVIPVSSFVFNET